MGPLCAIPALLAEHGLEPSRVLAEAKLPRDVFDDPDHRVPFDAAGRLLALCAERTRCPHFGVLVGERFTLDRLGILGTLMRNSPTLRDALRLGVRYLELQDRGATALTLELGPRDVALGYSLFDSGTPAVDQVLDVAIAVYCRMLRGLCGPSWRPTAVHLSHRRPVRIAPFTRCYGPAVEFDTPVSAVVFDARWLDRPIAGADPTIFAATIERVRAFEKSTRTPFVDDVRRAIPVLVLTGSASLASLANLFGLHERTLRRRLAAEGATVRGLVNEARYEMARHLLRETKLTASEIAGALHYSGVTAFCRAFRALARVSPQRWRAQTAAAR